MAKSRRVSEPPPQGLTLQLAIALVDMHIDEDMQARYHELSGKARRSPGEQDELDAIVRGNVLVGMLKAEARSVIGAAERA